MKEEINELGEILIHKQSGDFVTCNLSSLVINNAVDPAIFDGDKEAYNKLRKIIAAQVRATDSVITVNNLPVSQAQYTNNRYRAIS